MRAVGLSRYGGPEVLGLVELPDPQPTSEQVRIRVHAAGVNSADVVLRTGALASWYEGLTPPFVPGMDVAGVIDEIGDGVDPGFGLRPGQAVTGVVDNIGSHGGYSELVCLPAASVIPMPDGATFAQGASFLMNALTARCSLDALGLPAGATVLVAGAAGAAGAVGGYAVALAASDGLRPVALASATDEQFVRKVGGDEIIPRGGNAAERVRALVPAGVDAVIDAAGLGEQILPAVRDGGVVIALRPWSDVCPGRGIRIVQVNVRDRVTDRDAIAVLGEQASVGVLPLRVANMLPASEAGAAHMLLEAGGLRGRVVLDLEQMDS